MEEEEGRSSVVVLETGLGLQTTVDNVLVSAGAVSTTTLGRREEELFV